MRRTPKIVLLLEIENYVNNVNNGYTLDRLCPESGNQTRMFDLVLIAIFTIQRVPFSIDCKTWWSILKPTSASSRWFTRWPSHMPSRWSSRSVHMHQLKDSFLKRLQRFSTFRTLPCPSHHHSKLPPISSNLCEPMQSNANSLEGPIKSLMFCFISAHSNKNVSTRTLSQSVRLAKVGTS